MCLQKKIPRLPRVRNCPSGAILPAIAAMPTGQKYPGYFKLHSLIRNTFGHRSNSLSRRRPALKTGMRTPVLALARGKGHVPGKPAGRTSLLRKIKRRKIGKNKPLMHLRIVGMIYLTILQALRASGIANLKN